MEVNKITCRYIAKLMQKFKKNTQSLDNWCPNCRKAVKFKNTHLSENCLYQLCRGCGTYQQQVMLPELTKKVIYLDQFVLRNLFDNTPDFEKVAHLLEQLLILQIIAVPFSLIHETETYQWDDRKEKLFDFIRSFSNGKELVPDYEVEKIQLHQAFKKFLEGNSENIILSRSDAIPKKVDCWDGYIRIEAGRYIEPPETLRELKKEATELTISFFDQWQSENKSFVDLLQEETGALRQSLKNSYFQNLLLSVGTGNILDNSIHGTYLQSLILLDQDQISVKERFKRVLKFIESEAFQKIPYICISASLNAMLRKKVQQGQYQNREKAKNKISGHYFDTKCISVYAPYCDAMFIDNTMHSWLTDKNIALEKAYNVKLFSKSNMGEFITR